MRLARLVTRRSCLPHFPSGESDVRIKYSRLALSFGPWKANSGRQDCLWPDPAPASLSWSRSGVIMGPAFSGPHKQSGEASKARRLTKRSPHEPLLLRAARYDKCRCSRPRERLRDAWSSTPHLHSRGDAVPSSLLQRDAGICCAQGRRHHHSGRHPHHIAPSPLLLHVEQRHP